MFYNTRGLLERTEYADGTSERTLYDAEGRREYGYDRRGMGMQTVYDSLGRVEATWFIGDGSEAAVRRSTTRPGASGKAPMHTTPPRPISMTLQAAGPRFAMHSSV